MRCELTSDNSLIHKGPRNVNPPTLSKSFLQHAHKEHRHLQVPINVQVNHLLAQPLTDNYINWCPTCMKLLQSLPAEPLINHEVPQGSWQKISGDFMEMNNKRYLLIKDYFSKYPFLFQISSTTMSAVISHLTDLLHLKEHPWKTDNRQLFNTMHGYSSQKNGASDI